MNTDKKTKRSAKDTVVTIVSTVLCCVLLPVLIINCTLIAKSFMEPEAVPDVGGYFPMIVLTDSMYPTIESGDLILCKTAEPEDIQKGDIITFFDPAGNGVTTITHTVMEIVEEDGEIFFRTKGDANNVEDNHLVPGDKLIGTYKTRIPGAGNIAMFMQTTSGLLVCVVLPLIIMVGFDRIRRKRDEKDKVDETEALKAELEQLKAVVQAKQEENIEK